MKQSGISPISGKRLLFVLNEGYFFLSHRMPVALAAMEAGMDVHVAVPDDHVWAPESFDLGQLQDLGVTVHTFKLSRRGINPVAEILSFIAIRRLLWQLKPDLLHLLTIKPVIYGGMAARLCRLPAVVFAVTGLGQAFSVTGLRSRLLRLGIVAAYRLATGHRNCRVIVQNRDDQRQLVETGAVQSGQIELIKGSGVSLTEFTPQPEPDERPLVILPARLIWEKGVQQFVDAARQLREEGLSARFALIGDTQPSNPRAVPEATLKEWHDSKIVEWWGRRTDMPEVIARASIVVLPSYYGEGVPKILIEAAASARPIVTTDSPGCREIVAEGVNGYLVEPQDVAGLASAIRSLLLSSEQRQEMGAAGREIVEREFSDIIVAEKTMAIYLRLMDTSQGD
jgi:glycosyltransferase involved in cell wall biosynthesis